jgi:hypothetical protein
MEYQQLLAFHFGLLQRNVAVIVNIHGFDCFGTLKGSRILSGSSVNEMSCYCSGGCGGNIPYIFAHAGCQYVVYGCLILRATHITEHQQKTFPFGRTGCVRVDTLRQSRQRHPGGGLLRARHQYHTSSCMSPSNRRFAVFSRSVGLLL